ncbi:MAG TPA: copper chaperone PCu(A)C [Noviherbaspirillum sp.]|jgi:copper(I)-binding protein|uniref:copper chaperone PCu(A)C n=1 Tax=Noviherbaspirillum sp. TaxID=1926288 RepID=UPI002F955CEC
MKLHLILAAALLAAASAAIADVTVKEPWVRGTVAAQSATGAFMQLTASRDIRLVAARSPVAADVEIHEMRLENDVMRMRRIEGIDLPAGKQVDLKPGGYHLMFTGLKAPLREGDSVPVALVFEKEGQPRQTLDLVLPVRALHNRGGHGHGK